MEDRGHTSATSAFGDLPSPNHSRKCRTPSPGPPPQGNMVSACVRRVSLGASPLVHSLSPLPLSLPPSLPLFLAPLIPPSLPSFLLPLSDPSTCRQSLNQPASQPVSQSLLEVAQQTDRTTKENSSFSRQRRQRRQRRRRPRRRKKKSG